MLVICQIAFFGVKIAIQQLLCFFSNIMLNERPMFDHVDNDGFHLNSKSVKLGYNKLGYNEHSIITNSVTNERLVVMNKFMSQICQFCTKINPVIKTQVIKSKNVRFQTLTVVDSIYEPYD